MGIWEIGYSQYILTDFLRICFVLLFSINVNGFLIFFFRYTLHIKRGTMTSLVYMVKLRDISPLLSVDVHMIMFWASLVQCLILKLTVAYVYIFT